MSTKSKKRIARREHAAELHPKPERIGGEVVLAVLNALTFGILAD